MTVTAIEAEGVARVDCVDSSVSARPNATQCIVGEHIRFSVAGLLSYTFSNDDTVIHDLILLAGIVEFADREFKRSLRKGRKFSIRLAVHCTQHFEASRVELESALEFLTGDEWVFAFVDRQSPIWRASQRYLPLESEVQAVMPFSNGLDSLAVAGILSSSRDTLLRVRIGGSSRRRERGNPFAVVPYRVRVLSDDAETSATTRGFKFSLLAAIAAHLVGCRDIVFPESGQGIFGPSLLRHAGSFPDNRNHPLFAVRMERFVQAILPTEVKFAFPRLWFTKGETVKEFVSANRNSNWRETRSCWRNSRHVSVDGKRRQCGLCASCLLRRVSLHTAGLTDAPTSYVVEDLSASAFDLGFTGRYSRSKKSFLPYAVAAVQYMDDLAELSRPAISRQAKQLASTLHVTPRTIEANVADLSRRHRDEWESFMSSLAGGSFLRKWSRFQP